MNSQLKVYKFFISSLLVLIALGSVGRIYRDSFTVFANGGRNDECEDAQVKSIESGSENEISYTASDDKTVVGVCIKSGVNMFADGHSGSLVNGDYEDGCYSVTGVGTSNVRVSRNKDGRYCQGLSHLDAYTQDSDFPSDPEPDPDEEQKKVTLCHATGSETNPFVKITVSVNSVSESHGHEGHFGDIILSDLNEPCPDSEQDHKPGDDEPKENNEVGGSGNGENSGNSSDESSDQVLGDSTTVLAATGKFLHLFTGTLLILLGISLGIHYRRMFI